MENLFQKIQYQNKNFIIMRDDLAHPIFSGNKARKLAYILNNSDDYTHINRIVSFGGNQSNFMLALSQLAKINNWEFHYWIKPLPKFLKNHQNGNLKLAIENGMQLFEISDYLNMDTIKKRYDYSVSDYFFDQGGRDSDAEDGVSECAKIIKKYVSDNNIANYSVFVASGTGTTALYLSKHIPAKVYTVGCVGDGEYLLKQMNSVDDSVIKPNIITKNFKSVFGGLDILNYQTYLELKKQTNIEFDLLYDPIAWRTLIENYDMLPKPIIYIHCGGTSGNETMINRYKRKFNLD